MVADVDNGGEEKPHYGYEVEYLTVQSVGLTKGDGDSGVRKCAHPGARGYEVDLTPGTGERVPCLRLFDEDDELIAIYNPAAWLAMRKLARSADHPLASDKSMVTL